MTMGSPVSMCSRALRRFPLSQRCVWLLGGVLPLLAAAAPAPLAIDLAQSRIEIVVKATIDSFTATLSAYKADVQVDAGRVTAATITFDFADVQTGKPGRDETMHAWQDTPRHPHGVFSLRSLTTDAAGRTTAQGSLVFHEVARELDFPVSITTDRRLYAIDGEASLDTRDFALPIIRKFGLLKVDPVVKVRFHLQGSDAARPGPRAQEPSQTRP